MSDRAYTYIDRARAVVGNSWMERTWSAFLGHTTALVQKSGDYEWLSGPAQEFLLETDRGRLGVLDFGETAWSEENDTRGATLVSVQRRPGLELAFRVTALHDHPGFIRSAVVRNTGDEAVVIDGILPERLPIRREGLLVYTDDLSQGQASADWRAPHPGAALAREDRGLFFGQRGGGHFRLFSEDGECSVVVEGPQRILPGDSWRTAPTFLVPFTGHVRDAAATLYAQFLLRYLGQDEAHPARGE